MVSHNRQQPTPGKLARISTQQNVCIAEITISKRPELEVIIARIIDMVYMEKLYKTNN